MAKKRQPKQSKIILTIRATKKNEIDALNELKSLLREKTYSGALMRTATTYPQYLRNQELLLKENNKLSDEVEKWKEILSGWVEWTQAIQAVQKTIKQRHKPYRTLDE